VASQRLPPTWARSTTTGSGGGSGSPRPGGVITAHTASIVPVVVTGSTHTVALVSPLSVCASEKEGWGLTVIESNTLGTPVVATDADGLRDSVRDAETGFLVPMGDVAAFAERIGLLLENDALALRMSKAALDWSRTFDWEIAADEMARALEEARSGR